MTSSTRRSRKLRFAPDADVAMLHLTDSIDLALRQQWERERGRAVTPDPRPIPRRNDGTLVEILEEDSTDLSGWEYGVPMVRVQGSRTGDVFLVWPDEIHSVEGSDA